MKNRHHYNKRWLWPATLWLAGWAIGTCASTDCREISQYDLPLVISEPGHYLLVEDVRYTNDSQGIIVNADNVLLDLGGHTLSGDGQALYSCVEQSSQRGRLRICNGTIRNVGRYGVYALGEGNRLEDVAITDCGRGIYLGDGAMVMGCSFFANDSLGIAEPFIVGDGSLVTDTVVMDNTTTVDDSILLKGRNGCLFTRVRAVDNTPGRRSTVISGGVANVMAEITLENNEATQGSLYGIHAVQGSIIVDSVVRNHRVNQLNAECEGICASHACLVQDCVVAEQRTGSPHRGRGVVGEHGVVVLDCVVRACDSQAFQLDYFSVFEGCLAAANSNSYWNGIYGASRDNHSGGASFTAFFFNGDGHVGVLNSAGDQTTAYMQNPWAGGTNHVSGILVSPGYLFDDNLNAWPNLAY